jgi:hypothetical protein
MAESFLLHFSLPCFDSAGIPNLICPVAGVQSTIVFGLVSGVKGIGGCGFVSTVS